VYIFSDLLAPECAGNAFPESSTSPAWFSLFADRADGVCLACRTGDGANDSMALKAADVGISIASKEVEEEDSVNAAPSIAAPFSTKASERVRTPALESLRQY
jgi:hypothetical protein